MVSIPIPVHAGGPETLLSWTIVVTASAQTCGGTVAPAVDNLVTLIEQLYGSIQRVAVPGAVLGYAYAGVNWQTGNPELQRKARRVFRNVTIGLIIILNSEAIVTIVTAPFCGGG